MTILERISTLVRADINDLIDRAEDPEKVLAQLLLDMASELIDARSHVATAMADEKQLHEQYARNQADAADYHHRAEIAVEHGQDDVAREALTRRAVLQQAADALKAQYDAQAKQVEVLKQALGQLEDKIHEAQAKKDVLIARSRRARAETEIRASLTGLDEGTALARFERIERKVAEQEARAAALSEVDSDSVNRRLAQLETSEQVERELAELKSRRE